MLLSAFIALSCLIVGASAVNAADKEAEAKQYFRAGAQAYEAGRYAAAIRAFEHARALTPIPAIVFSLAQAYRLRFFEDRDPRWLATAKQLFRDYLEAAPDGTRRHDAVTALAELEPLAAALGGKRPTGSDARAKEAPTEIMITSPVSSAFVSVNDGTPHPVPSVHAVSPGRHRARVFADGYFESAHDVIAVENRLIVHEAELEPRPAHIRVGGTSGASVLVDGQPAGSIPQRDPIQVQAGLHQLVVLENGHRTWERELDLERGGDVSIEAELETTTQRALAWASIAAGGLALAAGGTLAVLAAIEDGDAKSIDAKRVATGISPAEL